jgi:undecaprenyl pyrophosphate phosphatase UppP
MKVDIALFFHICGVLTLFVSAALEITSLNRLRKTTTVAVARAWASLNRPLEFSFPIAVVVILASGLFMLHENPDFKQAQPWALTVLVVLVVLAILGAAINGKRMMGIYEALQEAPDGPLPSDIERRIHDPFLFTSIQTMTAAILGAILIMTVKPGLRDSIIVAGVSMILGAASAQAMLRGRMREPVRERVAVGAAEAE